jgi:heat-inducible transcriptional repressor
LVDTDKNTVIEASIDERARHLLKVLIERYIREGQPVGSRTLAHDSGLDLSPATVRNVMADLEELGFLHSPHTSAGRVPTARGYRFFVDSLMQIRPLPSQEVQELQRQLEIDPYLNTTSLVQSVSSLLSAITKMAGVVMVPRRNNLALRQVEFLPLSDNRVLAILVVNEKEVQNRVIQTDRDFTRDQLQMVANYLNAQFAGRDVTTVRDALLQEMAAHRDDMNELMDSVISVASQVFGEDEQREDYVLAGETNLMTFSELSDVEKLRELFQAFNEKRDILHLLDRCLAADGIQIFIGQESGYRAFDGVSLVTSTYSVETDVVGVLGVIGPTRMAYDRVIPIVDVTAKLLGRALNPSQ